MADYKEVRHENLYVRVPGGDKLRRTASARLRHLLAEGWRETERWHYPNYVTVRIERSGHAPLMTKLPPPPPQQPRGPRGGFGPHVGGLRALGTLGDLELDLLVLLEVAVAGALDRAEVHEDVRSVLLRDEAVALLRAEPLHGSCRHCNSLLPGRVGLMRTVRGGGEPVGLRLTSRRGNCSKREAGDAEPSEGDYNGLGGTID